MKKLTVEQKTEIMLHMPIGWDSDKFYDWLDENTHKEHPCPECGGQMEEDGVFEFASGQQIQAYECPSCGRVE